MLSEKFKILQILNEPNTLQSSDLSSYLLSNSDIIFIIIIGYFFMAIIRFLFFRPNFKFFFSKFFPIFKLDCKQNTTLASKLSLILPFFNLFIFTNLVILNNGISTDVLVVNTDEFIDSAVKLFATSKIFFYLESNEKIFKDAPKESLLYKLYLRNVIKKKTYFKYKLRKLKEDEKRTIYLENGLSSYFIFSNEKVALGTLIMLSNHIGNNQFAFMNTKTYFEKSNVFSLRKSLDDANKKQLHKRSVI